MTTKTELDALVAETLKANNRGSPKDAVRILLTSLVPALVDYVENPGVPFTNPREQAEALFNPPEPVYTEPSPGILRTFDDEGLTEYEKNEAIVKELEAEKAKTCEPCTVTEENKNGVAENPFLTTQPEVRLTAAEAPNLTGAVIQPVGGGVTIGEDGVPRGPDGVSLELLQDAQAMGINPEEAAKIIAEKSADAKAKVAPKGKAKAAKPEGEA